MRIKLKDSGGFTLVEMLCAVVILILLCLMLGTGLSMAMKTYQDITAESETQLLLNSLVDAIADELRYAHAERDDSGSLTYNGGGVVSLSNGHVVVDGKELLPTQAAGTGKGGAYRDGSYTVEELKINQTPELDSKGKIIGCYFILKLEVKDNSTKISAKTPGEGVIIRCLNPPEEKPSPGGGTL